MPHHNLGSNHTFENLAKAYGADPQGDETAPFVLYRGDEILALCVRYKFSPNPAEVWVGASPEAARRGQQLAELQGKAGIPVYYAPRSRTLYEFKGPHWVTGETTDPVELAKRNSPVPLSRIVFLHKTPTAPVHNPR